MMASVGCFDVLASPLLCCFGFLLRAALFFFCSVGTRLGFSFHFLPALLVRFSSSCFGLLVDFLFFEVAGVRLVSDQRDLGCLCFFLRPVRGGFTEGLFTPYLTDACEFFVPS